MPDPVQNAEALHGRWRRHGAKSAQGAVIPALGEGGQKKKKETKPNIQRIFSPMSFFIKPFVLQLWPLVVSRRATVSGKHTCAVPPAQTLSDQASIRCDSAKNKRWYLLLALAAQEVLPLPALALVCAVLLQVLQFGGGRRVVSLAGAVRSLPEEEAEE